MVTTKIFQHKNTTSYISDLGAPAQDREMSSPMAEMPSVIIPAVADDDDVFQNYGEDVVAVVLSEDMDAGGTIMYNVRFGDGGEFPVSE
jgi:hypothetical protein